MHIAPCFPRPIFRSFLSSGLLAALLIAIAAGAPLATASPLERLTDGESPRTTGAPAALQQFTAGGHVFGFKPGAYFVSNGSYSLNVTYVGAHAVAPQSDASVATGKVAPPSKRDAGTSSLNAAPLTRVEYPELWDGITLRYDAVAGGLARSSWHIAPGGDVSSIRMRYNRPLQIDRDGALKIAYDTGTMSESAPVAWQEVNGRKVSIDVRFVRLGDQVIGFTVGHYDRERALEIDPTLSWHTFLGADGTDSGNGITADASGNSYVTGSSFSTWGSPVRAFTAVSNHSDCFVAKLDTNGNLVWNTFLGGSGYDEGVGVALDSGGNIYIAGGSSADWGSPVLPYTAGGDALVAKLSPAGALIWHSFLGGSDNDGGNDIAVDAAGDLYVTGGSPSTWGSPIAAYNAGTDGYVARLTSSGALTWNTFLGGSTDDWSFDIAVDGSSNVYVTGQSTSTWGSPVRAYSAGLDTLVAKFNSAGGLLWNTFLGGSGDDYAVGIAIDASGNAAISGTSSLTWGSPVRAYTSNGDAFAALVSTTGTLTWNTFLGGTTDDYGNCVIIDSLGNVYVGGASFSSWGTPLRAYTGHYDGFVAKLTSAGVLVWTTFQGGTARDGVAGIGMDSAVNLYVTGQSHGTWSFPARAYSGGGDALGTKLNSGGAFFWNTFLGGSGDDYGTGITVDASGNVYVSGATDAVWETPVRAYSAGRDGFVAKLDPSGVLVWHTYLGSAAFDYATGVAVDASGNVYASGWSEASWGSPVRAYTGSGDGFVVKLDSSGALVWNTFLGAGGYDDTRAVTVDASGNVFAAGASPSTWGSPVRPYSADYDAYIVKLSPSGALTWNTFLGGTGFEGGNAIALDGSGNVFVTGSSASWGSPVRAHAGGQDAYAAKLSPTGALVWHSFVGGFNFDYGTGILVDGSGSVVLTGYTTSTWGTPVRAFTASGTNGDGFAAKLSSTGTLTWNTFLGGSSDDSTQAVVLSNAGNLYVGGYSATWGSPVLPFNGNYDGYVAKLTSSGALSFLGFVGGGGFDFGYGLAVDSSQNLFLAGTANDPWGSPVRLFGGYPDVFAAKIEDPLPTPTPTSTSTPSATPTSTSTSTPSNTPTSTSTHTPTFTPTWTPTWTPTPTPTFTPTHTPTNAATSTPTWTPTSTSTSTPTFTPTPTPQPGDCNADTKIDAGDLSALWLELFDGDGTAPANTPGGTFPGDPVGCNINGDSIVSAADMSCTVLVIFNGTGACP